MICLVFTINQNNIHKEYWPIGPCNEHGQWSLSVKNWFCIYNFDEYQPAFLRFDICHSIALSVSKNYKSAVFQSWLQSNSYWHIWSRLVEGKMSGSNWLFPIQICDQVAARRETTSSNTQLASFRRRQWPHPVKRSGQSNDLLVQICNHSCSTKVPSVNIIWSIWCFHDKELSISKTSNLVFLVSLIIYCHN